ncbi:MAG: DinB family protein [Fimbriimonadales bacterium]
MPEAPSPNLRDFVMSRLASVREDLDEVLSKLDQEMMEWAPGEGMRTVAGQLFEIAAMEVQMLARVKEGRRLTDEDAKQRFGDCDSLENLKKVIVAVRGRTLDYLDSLGPDEFDKHMAIEWIAMHEYYHVGQLISYLWARGDNPYRW